MFSLFYWLEIEEKFQKGEIFDQKILTFIERRKQTNVRPIRFIKEYLQFLFFYFN